MTQAHLEVGKSALDIELGALKTTRTAAGMETTGLVLQLYRARFGSIPLAVPQEFGAIGSVLAAELPRKVTAGLMTEPPAAIVETQPRPRYVAASPRAAGSTKPW